MRNCRIRSNVCIVAVLSRNWFTSTYIKPTQYFEPIIPALFNFKSKPLCPRTVLTSALLEPNIRVLSCCFTSYICSQSSNLEAPDAHLRESIHDASDDYVNGNGDFGDEDNDNVEDYDDEDFTEMKQLKIDDENVLKDVKTIVDILHEFGTCNRAEMKNKLQNCDIKASPELVGAVLSRVRNDWEAAFTFFLWSGKQSEYAHSVREYNLMISILGKMRKFDTAWTLIDEMRGRGNCSSLVTRQTLLIMIRRYCAVHDVGRAIHTFYAYKRFNFDIGIEEFQSLLSALCRYKNVKDAEHLLFCNKDAYPFDTKSFNIILNGWCNVIGSISEGERIWNEMAKRRIRHDVVSYASILSSYSKSGNLYKVLKLFERMKEMKIDPDRKVYNAVIHALAKGRMVKEATNLMKTMEEKGLAPNVVTYNSLIKPLCKARKIDEAREVFDDMLQKGLIPTIQTFHAFLRVLRTGEQVFAVLEKMKSTGCEPSSDTYIMLIRKFCRWRQTDNVFKLWSEMIENGVSPDRSSYIVLIHGLFLNGELQDAYKFYLEMKEKELVPEPKIEEMIQAWLAGKQMAECQVAPSGESQLEFCGSSSNTMLISNKCDRKVDFRRKPETRRVVRERGFAFWKQ